MVAIFCLRLGCGMIASLLLLSPAQVQPRFFRVHFLAVLGLTVLAGIFLFDQADVLLWLALGSSMGLAFLGSVVWHLEGAPGGEILKYLTTAALGSALVLAGQAGGNGGEDWGLLADDLTSAGLLGAAVSAMLMGHSYLIAPAMSLTPLLRLHKALFATLVLRMVLAGLGLWLWTEHSSPSDRQTETYLWFSVRWALGFLAPLVLGWLAFETARIRSTQSATGILYVVVIVCFLGELTEQLLRVKTGYTL